MLNGYKTYIGIAIAVIGAVAGLFGWSIPNLEGLQNELVTLVGAAIAIYGRVKVGAIKQ